MQRSAYVEYRLRRYWLFYQTAKIDLHVSQALVQRLTCVVPGVQVGYPGGIFDPLGFSKGNLKELQTKEVKNGRLAMVAFMGFVLQAQATGKGPLASLSSHLGNPAGNNWLSNIGSCVVPNSVNVEGEWRWCKMAAMHPLCLLLHGAGVAVYLHDSKLC